MVQRVHRDFNPSSFFKKSSRKYLYEFFDRYGILNEQLNIPVGNQADYLIGFLNRFPEDAKEKIEEELQTINDMSSEKGRFYLQNEFKNYHSRNLGDFTHHDLSIYLYLKYREKFEKAWTIAHVEEWHGWRQFRSSKPKSRINITRKTLRNSSQVFLAFLLKWATARIARLIALPIKIAKSSESLMNTI
jgi:hypothetical protein